MLERKRAPSTGCSSLSMLRTGLSVFLPPPETSSAHGFPPSARSLPAWWVLCDLSQSVHSTKSARSPQWVACRSKPGVWYMPTVPAWEAGVQSRSQTETKTAWSPGRMVILLPSRFSPATHPLPCQHLCCLVSHCVCVPGQKQGFAQTLICALGWEDQCARQRCF